jgi:hypothetical protein
VSEYQSRFRSQAREYLKYYIKLAATNDNVRWDRDNDYEVEEIIDLIISAVKDELTHEKECP